MGDEWSIYYKVYDHNLERMASRISSTIISGRTFWRNLRYDAPFINPSKKYYPICTEYGAAHTKEHAAHE